MEKTQFELLMIAIVGLDGKITGLDGRITGLDGKISTLRAETQSGFKAVDAQFNEMRNELRVIREQTAHNTVEIAALKPDKTPSA